MDTIAILDFGSQYTQLIARRIRELQVYAIIVPGTTPFSQYYTAEIKGIILSGSPYSVYDERAPQPDSALFQTHIPILGICYGAQFITQFYGGNVQRLPDREYGQRPVSKLQSDILFDQIPEHFISWMSHGDSIETVPHQFSVLAKTDNGIPAAIKHNDAAMYGVQFHPEVTHCEYGIQLLDNFITKICSCKKEWNMHAYIEEIKRAIVKKVGETPLVLLISGGVDSTVAGALLLKLFPAEQVHLLYIDTGLMRNSETEEVIKTLNLLGAKHIHVMHEEDNFLNALQGISDPEEKRKIIGDKFVTVQEKAVAGIGLQDYILVQGTLYTDLIESGKGVGTHAQVIKSHHNVRSPLIEKKRNEGKLIEPLDRLYKDEVRELGRTLGLPESIVSRHPFPGTGLAVGILGEVTKESCDLLRKVDELYINFLREHNLYSKIWQAFAVLLPIRSVGVAGDERKYGYTVALRAVESRDGMTADVFEFDIKQLKALSSLITNKISGIGRVVYDISSKPPATIEWE
ncbi:MAG TPA: glutamine-hydrolyzing GMP synthase [Spirochaetales bacterium]|nr:glutamine-hydrolyzing GMP synthase [Spirochaetales bacterium]